MPVSDGGDGLLDAAVGAGFERVPLRASGPTGVLGDTSYARRGTEAVVEMAEVCGLARLPGGELGPAHGDQPRGRGGRRGRPRRRLHARSCSGSAAARPPTAGPAWSRRSGRGCSTRPADELDDGGAGPGRSVASLERSGLHAGLDGAVITVACDVDNPLTGPTGAAAVYGPQKGADPDLVADPGPRAGPVGGRGRGRHRRRPARRRRAPGRPVAIGFGAMAVLGARLRPGAEVVQELTGLEEALAGADLVVTGEGSLDEQTLHGKAPAGVAAAARRAGVPVVAVAGRACWTEAALARQRGSDRATRWSTRRRTRTSPSTRRVRCWSGSAPGSRREELAAA